MTKDEAGTAHLYDAHNAFLTEDRSNKANSALIVKSGYIRIPSGVYFNGDFTFMARVKFNQRFSKLFVFGHSSRTLNIFCDDRVVTEIEDWGRRQKSYYKTQCIVSTLNKDLLSKVTELKKDQWMHLALVLSENSLILFLNNTLSGKTSLEMLRNEYFDSNFIGKQNEKILDNYSITYDEIKMFDRSLTDYELRNQ